MSSVANRDLQALLARDTPHLDELALCIARDAYPGLSDAPYLAYLDELGARLHTSVGAKPNAGQAVAALANLLFDEEGFSGNHDDYYDPRNSYLNQVIDRRLGLPITLTVLAMSVCRRAGVDAEGVGFPGRFLLRVRDDDGAGQLVDPFERGRPIDEAGLDELTRRYLGNEQALRPSHLAAQDARSITRRMLINLKSVHAARGDFARALIVSDRLVEIGAPITERRDRGLFALMMGAYAGAKEDLAAYLELRPNAPDRVAVHDALARARSRGQDKPLN